jgi:hypothetical protein
MTRSISTQGRSTIERILREVTGFSLNKVRHKFHNNFFAVCEFIKVLKFVLCLECWKMYCIYSRTWIRQEAEHLLAFSTKIDGMNDDGDYAYQTIQPHLT